jgi:hypothetical protein
MISRPATLLLCSIFALASQTLAADAPSAAETKLRESLRNTMLQMRTLQGERDTLQAEKDTAEAEKADLATKLETLSKQHETTKAENEKAIADLQTKLANQEKQNALLSESRDKWVASQKEAAALAESKEAARAKLNSEKIALQRKVDNYLRKNIEMHKLGMEILDRYENFGLGTALTAREPFIGQTKIRLQNYTQDFGEKLNEQKIKEGVGSSSEIPPSAGTPAVTESPATTRKMNPPSRRPEQKANRQTRPPGVTTTPNPTPSGPSRRS